MRRLILTSLFTISLVGGVLAVLSAPAPAHAFDISQGIVGNLASEACRVQGDCGWCDFVDMMVVMQKIILYLFGGLALCMLIWGGFGIVTAAGNQEKITGARKLIISTLFGVLVILAAYFVTGAIYNILATPRGSQPTAVLGESWWRDVLHCYTPKDDKFCTTAPDGALCYKPNNDPYLCEGGKCTKDAACASPYGLGAGAQCMDISQPTCAASGADTNARRANCTAPHCKLDVCSGGSNRVCCK